MPLPIRGRMNGNKCPVRVLVCRQLEGSASQAVSHATEQPLHLPSLLVRPGGSRHPGQATRDVCSRRDEGEESTNSDPKVEESEVSAFELEDWARGAGWEGAKSTATFMSGKQAALQRLVVKPVPDSDGFQEKVGRQVHPVYPGFGVSTRRAEGILDQ